MTKPYMTLSEVVAKLRARVLTYDTHWQAAEAFGVSAPTLSKILAGKQLPNQEVCGSLGVVPDLVYMVQARAKK